MKVQMIVVRCEKVSDDIKSGEPGPRLKVATSSAYGGWTLMFPLDFAKHVHVGQSLTVDVAVG